ncbi:hypothetical protein [Frigidibacter sp. ROC022]|uniref:hypothetical protein n=1 Tax=Frigidibacter sp. ROC022 TaxID=2971796 RepID=UPI00215A40AB|nr:hypothetical protein [Frigidibacter sp. ROC022]MCR8723346.1 hypothetical protein [Frigidibacter sp. ROC022]
MAELSDSMKALAEGIRRHPNQVQTALLGFDLWLEVLSSEHVSPLEFTPGGIPATGAEDEKVLKVPVPVLGKRIVISFDASLPPDQFLLRP